MTVPFCFGSCPCELLVICCDAGEIATVYDTVLSRNVHSTVQIRMHTISLGDFEAYPSTDLGWLGTSRSQRICWLLTRGYSPTCCCIVQQPKSNAHSERMTAQAPVHRTPYVSRYVLRVTLQFLMIMDVRWTKRSKAPVDFSFRGCPTCALRVKSRW